MVAGVDDPGRESGEVGKRTYRGTLGRSLKDPTVNHSLILALLYWAHDAEHIFYADADDPRFEFGVYLVPTGKFPCDGGYPILGWRVVG